MLWTLLFLAAVAAALLFVALRRRLASPARGRVVLSGPEVRFLEAVSETVFPPAGPVPLSGLEAGIPGYMDRYLGALPARFRRLIRLLFLLFEWGPLLFAGRPVRASSLSPDARKRYLEGWEASRLYARRMAAQGLKTLLCIAYMAHPGVKEAIGVRRKSHCARSPESVPSPGRPNARNVEGIVQFGDLRGAAVIRESADFCIVGSGAAGAVLAHELAAAGKTVVVLEEGSYWTGAEVPEDPAYALRLLFREAGFRACRGRSFVPTMQACCVGGTTFVNSSICFRFPDRILNEWACEHGIEHLTPEALAPSYERVERIAGIRPVAPEVMGAKNRLFRRGTEALGIHGHVFSRAERDCRGCSECMPACPTGAKQSMERSYLPAAVRNGARVYADCRAEKVVTLAGRAAGVRGVFRDPSSGRPAGEVHVSARAVILSAGVMDSPVILLKNRIGNSSGWVGRNLVHHPGSALFGVFDEVVNPWEGATQGFGSGQYLDRDVKLEVIWGPPAYLAVRLPGFGRELQGHLARYRHAAAWDCMVRGASRGRVCAGADWTPRITYSLIQKDVDRIVEGLRVVAEMFFAAGAHTVLPGVHGLPAEARGMRDLAGLRAGRVDARRMVIVSNHAFGTCRMGADPKRAVVDPFCQSYDIRDLYVCDSSVFPTGTGVNPMEPIMVFADVTAQELKQRY